MASFKLNYDGTVKFSISNDVIKQVDVDYRLNVSQSYYSDKKLYTRGIVSYNTSQNWSDQTANSTYDWLCKPLYGDSPIPNFLNTLGSGSYSASISTSTSSFSESDYWDDSENGSSEFPTLPNSSYYGLFGFCFDAKYKPTITVTE